MAFSPAFAKNSVSLSKIRYTTLFAVVVVGCSPQHESKIESDVFVERQIEENDQLLYAIATWSMTLRPQGVSFGWTRASADVAYRPKMMMFSDPKEATDALAKFVEWDESARQNNVEPFRKSLADKCTFEFAHGSSTLQYYWKTPYATFSGEFSRADVDKFNELLKQLPEVKAELEAKIAKAEKEATLFTADERKAAAEGTSIPTADKPIEIPARAIAPAATEQVTLNRDFEVTYGYAKGLIIPKGSKLEVFSRGAKTIGVRYGNESVSIPRTATTESK